LGCLAVTRFSLSDNPETLPGGVVVHETWHVIFRLKAAAY
jgi:hypothetical protein